MHLVGIIDKTDIGMYAHLCISTGDNRARYFQDYRM